MTPGRTIRAELQVTTNYSFLRGASHPEEMFAQAAAFGIEALGVTDRGSLAGIVRAHEAAKTTGVRLITGCRLDLDDAGAMLVYSTDRAAYARLCRLLTIGKGRAGKGGCRLAWDDLAEWGQGLIAVLLPDEADVALARRLDRLRADFGDRAYLALGFRRRPNDALRLHELAERAAAARVPTVAVGDVLYHAPGRRILQDVMTCIREGRAIDEMGFRRERFADRFLLPPEETARRFARHPGAVARAAEIADRCRFSLDELRYQYPAETPIPGLSPQQALERLAREGAARRYPGGVSAKVARQIEHELRLIATLGYAPYFLTVNAIVAFARSKGILCQGRGSAANSAVCFVLGITSIDPEQSDLLFERFVSQERNEPPDIDVDFEHDRREEVIQWIYETYGRTHAALTATVIRYRARGAVRDVGKALGLGEDVTAALAAQVWGWSLDGVGEREATDLALDLHDRRLRLTLGLARRLIGFPRHLSQHPGGFVLTHDRLDELVPIEPAAMKDRQVIEWDKDDIDALRFMKVDVLGLGMLGCMRRAFDLLRRHKGQDLDLASIPQEDPATYAMIREADTVGVFQIESRAQMAMLPRIKPRTFYDLVVEVAIVRPGPIQGDMVHPYLRRREGQEPVEYPRPELEKVLGKTLGVPLFQEQAMRVAIECAGFTPSEADQLRRSMATFKFTGGVSKFRDKLVAGMVTRGYDREFAERTFRQLEGFGSYGFPESHAASFALIAYASSWMKCWHPDVFCCAILDAQPMGFYAPAQLVRDARAHGVEVRPVSVGRSQWTCTLEPMTTGEPARGEPMAPPARFAVRLGLRMVAGLAEAEAARIVAARARAAFDGIEALWRQAGVSLRALRSLARADAFAESLGLGRREALWAIRALAAAPLPLFAAADAHARTTAPEVVEPAVTLTPMTAGRAVVEDYAGVGLTLRPHPLSFLRGELASAGNAPLSALARARDGSWLRTAGLVLIRQRPGSAKGVVFITLEDETGLANLIVWPDLFDRERRTILSARLLACRGRVQREGEGEVIHLVAYALTDMTALLHRLAERDAPFPLPPGRGDEARRGGGTRDPRQGGPGHKLAPTAPRACPGLLVRTRDFR